MYYELAHLYDWPGSLDFAQQIQGRVTRALAEHQVFPPARLVDLACGTGTLAIELARQGYDVLGLDLSASMIALARKKHAQQPGNPALKLRFQTDDMRFFLLDEPVDAVLCHYDSLNHLSNESELRGTLIQVAQALRPDGVFLFDLNTLDNYQTFWNGTDSDEGPNYRLKTTASFDAQLGRAEVLFQVDEYPEDGAELCHREERVVEHYFNELAVEKYLKAAGFYAIESTTFNPVPDLPEDIPLKTFWQCRKSR